MEPLSPKQAVHIANKVYDVQKMALNEIAALKEHNPFITEGAGHFEATAGVSVFKTTSGFGYVAKGEGTRKNDALIAIRGTIDAADWLTDLNVSFDEGPSGDWVHAGFNRCFGSFKDDVDALLNKFGPSNVHIVGHSLGGALASLTADFVSQKGVTVKLYSFGAPRVLTNAGRFTRKLGQENIYRVYHTADPVSMVPIFPFQPVPTSSMGHFMIWNGSVAVAPHLIANYLASVGDMDWRGLCAHVVSSKAWWENQTKDFLEAASEGHYVAMGSAATLWMIQFALAQVTSKINAVLNDTVIVGFTALDRLSRLLYTGALDSVKIADQVRKILFSILSFTGRAVDKSITLTVAFIRWVLEVLFRVVSTAALAAVHATIQP